MRMEMSPPVKRNRPMMENTPRDHPHPQQGNIKKSNINSLKQRGSADQHRASAEELSKAIRTMKSGKALGANMVKAGGYVTTGAFIEIFEGIWEEEETPGDWNMGLIVNFPKKGDLSLCKNWRGITMLFITIILFSRMVLTEFEKSLTT